MFQVLLVLQNNSETTLEMPGVDVTVEPVGVHASQFDLSFDFTERFLRGCPDGMTGRFDFSKDLFDDAGAQAVLDRFLRLLRGVLMDPDTHLGDIDILGEEERGRLLHEFTDTAAPEGPVDIVDIVRGYAEDQPDRPALVDEDGVVTYRQLARRAGALSARLLTVDAQPGDVAAVLAQRSVHIPTALLGILGAGAAYTPLSPTAPTSRNAAMLADSGARWIITDPASQSTAEDLVVGTDVEVICLDHEEAAGMPPLAGRPEDLAYIIFTSGSTGRPKGAMVHRRGMANHLLAKVDILRLTDEDMIVANAPLSFDISIWQMLAALVIGGTIRVVDDETAMDAEALFKLAEKENVTILEVVPSLLRTVLDLSLIHI